MRNAQIVDAYWSPADRTDRGRGLDFARPHCGRGGSFQKPQVSIQKHRSPNYSFFFTNQNHYSNENIPFTVNSNFRHFIS